MKKKFALCLLLVFVLLPASTAHGETLTHISAEANISKTTQHRSLAFIFNHYPPKKYLDHTLSSVAKLPDGKYIGYYR